MVKYFGGRNPFVGNPLASRPVADDPLIGNPEGGDVESDCEGDDVESDFDEYDVESDCEGYDVESDCEGGDVESDCEGGDVESDCEGDSSGVTDEPPEMEGEQEVLPRAILMVGSFSTYVHSHFQYPFLFSVEVTNSPGGNLSFSISAQTKSRSLLSDRKVSAIAQITSARTRLRRLPRLVLQRAYTSWQLWYGDPQLEATNGSNVLNYYS